VRRPLLWLDLMSKNGHDLVQPRSVTSSAPSGATAAARAETRPGGWPAAAATWWPGPLRAFADDTGRRVRAGGVQRRHGRGDPGLQRPWAGTGVRQSGVTGWRRTAP
jgi:hypothetical protein